LIPGGSFAVGDAEGGGHRANGVGPVHLVELDMFEIDATAVTIAGFARFIDITSYRTEAEAFGYFAVWRAPTVSTAPTARRPPAGPQPREAAALSRLGRPGGAEHDDPERDRAATMRLLPASMRWR
jgi:formylglycine-generating enzyme required for sulfatase activity